MRAAQLVSEPELSLLPLRFDHSRVGQDVREDHVGFTFERNFRRRSSENGPFEMFRLPADPERSQSSVTVQLQLDPRIELAVRVPDRFELFEWTEPNPVQSRGRL